MARRPGARRAAAAAAGDQHHVALSIVGTDRTPDNGDVPAKVAPEKLIEACRIPYTIIRATQFLEFLSSIARFEKRIGRVVPSRESREVLDYF